MARKPKKLPVAITEEEFERLIRATKKPHHRVAFLLGFEAGLRISEVVNLQREDIDFEQRRILVKQGKGSKDRIVPLPKRFKENMIRHFPLKCGVRSLQMTFKRYCEKSKLLETKPELHFHSLRHGFATRLVSQGVPIHHIRTMLGHSNISTTNVYLEANPIDALKSYEDLF